jgi:hypothetical protein
MVPAFLIHTRIQSPVMPKITLDKHFHKFQQSCCSEHLQIIENKTVSNIFFLSGASRSRMKAITKVRKVTLIFQIYEYNYENSLLKQGAVITKYLYGAEHYLSGRQLCSFSITSQHIKTNSVA